MYDVKDNLVGIDANGELILLKLNAEEDYDNLLYLVCDSDTFLGNPQLYPKLYKLNPQRGDIYLVDIEVYNFTDHETGYGFDDVFFDNFRKVIL